MPNKFEISARTDDVHHLVCARATTPPYLPDNVVAQCSRCFHMVQHRPDVAKHLKIVCLECARPEMQIDADVGELTVRTSPRHRDEFLDWLKKKQH